jgi:NAD(P)-dependent dehydrogenase (short-subunit alcohol dehydrogenase family)
MRINKAVMNDSTPTSLVWLVTGCSSGLGRALASLVLARGHRLIASARDPSSINELVSLHPENCRPFALDVADAAQAKAVVAQGVEAFGRLDVVVNNAGYGVVGAFEELGDEQITRNFDTNFFGALEVIRAALPILRGQRSGHIVNISAAAVIANYAGFSIYGATKWALEGVSEALAAELKPLGIKVTIVQPGPFRTDFIGRSLQRAQNHIADYDRTSGKFLRFLESMEGKQPGDPAKAAEAIISAVESDAPPLRLVLGRYANDKARKKFAEAERERATWEHIGLPTDFVSNPQTE